MLFPSGNLGRAGLHSYILMAKEVQSGCVTSVRECPASLTGGQVTSRRLGKRDVIRVGKLFYGATTQLSQAIDIASSKVGDFARIGVRTSRFRNGILSWLR